MRIETWGEDTEKTEKEKTKQYLRAEKIYKKQREKKYKPPIRISISPYILTIATAVFLLAFVIAGMYFVKVAIIDNSIISETIAEVFGENSSLLDIMWLMTFMIVPLYLIMKLCFRGSHVVY